MSPRKAKVAAVIVADAEPPVLKEPSPAAARAYLEAEEHVHGRVATCESEVIWCLRAAYAVDFPGGGEANP